ncbi:putative MFS family arabinose efflux permease [Stackebrandtia albiflava]|uniref:Putative MFS family arabinose efflux permease n=1 Tax=Stackebrandtia albiflava TaxID=406432 RepID=A0A562VDR3_9ACTN|nr:MFS transporter [Stackebrandtia albiflava]TWJ16023.1 putative MFS family arabinose efflux permease [Stackebrandtia albiflava]
MSSPHPRRLHGFRRFLGSVVVDTRPLRIPAYRRLWVSGAVTAIGSQLTAVAVPKQVYDLTDSSAMVGVSGAVALVPLLVFGLWGGAIADTLDRRRLMVFSNVGVAATSALLWLQAWLDLRSVWLVLLLLGLNQVFFAINSPARSAAIARLVPDELVPPAVALGSTTMQFGAVMGPMAAGALMPFAGLSTLYLVDTVALALAVVAVWRLPAMPPLNGPSRRAGLRDVWEGFRYLRLQQVLLASFLLDVIAMVAGMPRALFPEMAERTFGDPAGGGIALGWLYAAIPLGALLCGLMSGRLSRLRRHGVGVTVSVCLWGAAIVGFGLSGSLWVAVAFLALAGAADFASMVYRGSMLQQATTDEMRGRLQGVFIVVVAGGPRLADLTHGWVGETAGTSVSASGGGVLVIVLTIVAVALIPSFWRYRTGSGSRSPEAASAG